ncbi:nucleoside-specific channel-forming protein Tsx [Paraburkholderia sp. D1E]|uniref:nucleoside-specific channel-forming protein Tsx n=1 Tax=Paraburkholderia sp. D1E TaxID=3461398 RepID=UPI004045E4B8
MNGMSFTNSGTRSHSGYWARVARAAVFPATGALWAGIFFLGATNAHAADAADSNAANVAQTDGMASSDQAATLMSQSAGPSVGVGESALLKTTADEKPWLHQTISLINSSLTRFGPYRTGDVYLEYEYYGRKGPFDLYGYVDAPKVLDVGSQHSSGIWDKGSPVFSEQEPRVALDTLAGRNLQFGPFSHIYLATDWIYDMGQNQSQRQNTLYFGVGTDIDTHTPLALSANLYVRRQWENYGAANEDSWDGYRLAMNYFYPLGHFLGGDVSYAGFFDYDFGSKLREETGDNSRTDTAFVATNGLVYSRGHLRLIGVARYFHNGGQWNGVALNFGEGEFQNRSTGWGYYLEVGYQF